MDTFAGIPLVVRDWVPADVALIVGAMGSMALIRNLSEGDPDMLTDFTSEHWVDNGGRPAGGTAFGPGFAISWQNGPLGRGDDRKEPNGAFVETVLAAVKDRLAFYQQSGFACQENVDAIDHIEDALEALDARTKKRVARGVEGTHSV